MAMIKCPECGNMVSDKAKACVNCGYPIAEMMKEPGIITSEGDLYITEENNNISYKLENNEINESNDSPNVESVSNETKKEKKKKSKSAIVLIVIVSLVAAFFLILLILLLCTKEPIFNYLLIGSGVIEFAFAFILYKIFDHRVKFVCPCCGETRIHHRQYVRTDSKQSTSNSTKGVITRIKYTHVYNDSYVCPSCGETLYRMGVTRSGGSVSYQPDGHVFDNTVPPREF